MGGEAAATGIDQPERFAIEARLRGKVRRAAREDLSWHYEVAPFHETSQTKRNQRIDESFTIVLE